MIARYFISGPVLVAAALLSPACSSRDQQAAAAAAIASDALQQGQLVVARKQINKALAVRDDVSDYWMLSAHIALAEQNYLTAFEAYESVILFDPSNSEALTRLCQIAVSADQPERAERYADLLAVLDPADKSATTVKAAIALKRSDKHMAEQLLDKVLTASPGDPLALGVKSKLLVANEDYAGAVLAGEAAMEAPGDPFTRLTFLKSVYLKIRDNAGYSRTVARIARSYPEEVPVQMDYATNLYDTGDVASGLEVTKRILALRPDDITLAHGILDLWIAHGTQAMPLTSILVDAANGSLQTKATYAQYATAIGHPELALRVLGQDAERDPATAVNADTKAARAHARVPLGAVDLAKAEIMAVLAADDDHPGALVARGLLRAKAGDQRGAIEDLRHALAGNPDNANARLILADLQMSQGQAELAKATLQGGLRNPGADPRIAVRLAKLLRGQGRDGEAAAVLKSYANDNPFVSKLGA
jgi:tetratricopeptide (TPR) repeat protein